MFKKKNESKNEHRKEPIELNIFKIFIDESESESDSSEAESESESEAEVRKISFSLRMIVVKINGISI